jgi:predicted transcriptional regulator
MGGAPAGFVLSKVMNAKLKDIIERAETWPDWAQEHAIELLLSLEREYADPYQLTEDDKAAIDRSMEHARQGRFATDEEVAEVFNRHRQK